MEIESKPVKFVNKFKELMDLLNSMSKEDFEMLMCALEHLELHEKYPQYINLL